MTEQTHAVSAPRDVHEVVVPREIVNADSVYVIAWSIPDGTYVEPGTELCTVDTSKAAVTIPAEHAGHLRHRSSPGDEVPVGGVLGYLTPTSNTPLPESGPALSARTSAATISPKAQRKIEELGLDPALFASRGLVRERDVVEFATSLRGGGARPGVPPAAAFRVRPLSVIQRRVAAAMALGAAIPVAYLSRDVEFAPVRDRAMHLSRESKMLITPVDLLVAAVARASAQHRVFNAAVAPPLQLHVFEDVNVGLAVDVENDLYVVVVKQAQCRSIPEIATELRRLQMLVQRRRLGVDDVTGGTVTVTSMIGCGVHRFQPILNPGQTAIVAVADPFPGSTRVELTVGFDHRVANGIQAAAFMAAVDRELRGETA